MLPGKLRIETARRIVEAALSASATINGKLRELQAGMEPEEFRWCQLAFGAVLMTILTDILNPIFVKYPSLKPEGFE